MVPIINFNVPLQLGLSDLKYSFKVIGTNTKVLISS